MTRKLGLLATSDGEVFRGVAVGSDGVTTGEVVFNTSMSGYQEVLTDPSYAGQIVTMTSPHIGNYGSIVDDNQASQPVAQGLVVRSMSRTHSNWRADGGFDEFLVEAGVIALTEVDTRRLTRHVRSHGAMPAAIGSDVSEGELKRIAARAPSMVGRNLVGEVTTRTAYSVGAIGTEVGRVAAIDLGIKRDILDHLALRGLRTDVFSATATTSEILDAGPNGVFLSNGPGDPKTLTGVSAVVRELLGTVPVMGICLGYQVLGLALGARTFKLPFGHHGGNHPVLDLDTGQIAITAQNHGFSVDLSTTASATAGFGRVRATHRNLNDGTLEGLSAPDVAAFGVQFHPEAAPGPADAVGLFDSFVTLMGLDVVHA